MGKEKKTILLVEDEVIIAMDQSAMLSRHGYEVVTANSGEEAVLKCLEKDSQVSLVLMDVGLGAEMDGTEAASKILAKKDIPIIFLSNHSEKEYVEKVRKISGYGYVLKSSGEFVILESINMAFDLYEEKRKVKEKQKRLSDTLYELRKAHKKLEISHQEKIETDEIINQTLDQLKRAQRLGKIGSLKFNLNDGSVVFSEEACNICGIEKKKFYSFPEVQQIPIEKDRYVLDDGIKNLVQYGIPYDFEVALKNRPNCYIHTVAEYDSDENVIYSTIQDITEQKEYQRRLKESEEKYRLLADNSVDLIWTCKPRKDNFEMIYINPAVQKFFDYTVEEFLNLPIEQRVAAESLPIVDKAVSKLENGQEFIVFQIKHLHKSGKKIDCELSVKPVFDKKGNIIAYQGRTIDMTERNRNEARLAQEREQLAVTLRSIGDAVITTDIEGRVNLINRQAEKLTGWKQEEAFGKDLTHVLKLVKYPDGDLIENPVDKVLSSGTVVELENKTVLISKNGKEIPIADSGAPIKDRNSKTVGVVLVFRDMTDKENMHIAVERAARMESLGILAGGIAHDFNNLLGGIYGFVDLARQLSNEEKIKNYLSKSVETLERARHLTGQLLTFAKGGSPVKKAVLLKPFVRETAEFALSGSSISCNYHFDENLWNAEIDKNQIGQVLDNLVINAQQAMPSGGEINITAENVVLADNVHPVLSDGKYVKISVEDQGSGIPDSILPKIFEPFFTTKNKGQGLGLATCYSIVEKHEGSLEVESEIGKGTVFHVFLPATQEAVDLSERKDSASHRGSGNFIIMDDEYSVREALKQTLEDCGYDVYSFDNGDDAVSKFIELSEKDANLVGMIFDLTVPGKTGGLDSVKRIRELNKNIPVFVASGYSGDPVMSKPIDYGFTASIFKPFKIADLYAMLNEYL